MPKKNILVTGGAGFIGSHLSNKLLEQGHCVTILDSLNTGSKENVPERANFYNLDLSKSTTYKNIPKDFEIIFHLAAQPLILDGYKEPYKTYAINTLGTLNILEISRKSKFVRSLICVTSDKCYENLETNIPFKETDRIGGFDPYSSSKAAVEILVKSYQKSF